jgi:hypothetical protein
MSDNVKHKVFEKNFREWFDQTGHGFASAEFELEVTSRAGEEEHTWFDGCVHINDGSDTLYLDLDAGYASDEEDHAERMRVARNKIAVIRQALNVAEQALDEYEAWKAAKAAEDDKKAADATAANIASESL